VDAASHSFTLNSLLDSVFCREHFMADWCVFCAIAQGSAPASIICENALALAVVDLRQFHPGHTLVIPRQHFHDVRELDDTTGAALMAMVSRVTRAVGRAFPNHVPPWIRMRGFCVRTLTKVSPTAF
jgi:galactose-1-phosphate uridylyltransferase